MVPSAIALIVVSCPPISRFCAMPTSSSWVYTPVPRLRTISRPSTAAVGADPRVDQDRADVRVPGDQPGFLLGGQRDLDDRLVRAQPPVVGGRFRHRVAFQRKCHWAFGFEGFAHVVLHPVTGFPASAG